MDDGEAMANLDPDLQLSSSTLDALKGFYAERDARQQHFHDLESEAERDFSSKPLSMDAFDEDWNASQFWYAQETASALARALLRDANAKSNIAVVSAPSVFVQLKNEISAMSEEHKPQIALLEFDSRFAVFKEFVPYDYTHPLRLPEHLKASFDRIICDPPFLNEDCQTKAAMTVKWLSTRSTEARVTKPRIIVCTGERMFDLVHRLYKQQGVRTTSYSPVHAKGLSNEFCCFSNFTCDEWSIDQSAQGATEDLC